MWWILLSIGLLAGPGNESEQVPLRFHSSGSSSSRTFAGLTILVAVFSS